jgi:hypothetical protein
MPTPVTRQTGAGIVCMPTLLTSHTAAGSVPTSTP